MPIVNRRRIGGIGFSKADEERLKAIVGQRSLRSGVSDWRQAALSEVKPYSQRLRQGFTGRAQQLGVPHEYAPYVGETAAFVSEMNPLVSIPEVLADVSIERPESLMAASTAALGVVPGLGGAMKLAKKVEEATTTEPVAGEVRQKKGSKSDIPVSSKLDPTNPVPTAGLGGSESGMETPGTEVTRSAKGLGDQTITSKAEAKGLGKPAIIRAKPKVTAKHPISSVVPTVPVSQMKATYEPSGSMLPEKRISIADLEEGGTIIPMRGDPTIAGQRLTGLGGQLFNKAVELPGGPGFTRGPQQVRQGLGWASHPSPSSKLSNRAAAIFRQTGKPVYGAYMKMSEHSGDFAAHQAKTVKEMYDLVRHDINPAMKTRFDEAMRTDWKLNKKTGKYEYPAVQNWPGIDRLTDEWIVKAAPNDRKKMVKMMNQKPWQDAGFPDVGYARWAITEPELLDVPSHTSGFGVVKFDPEGRVTQTPEIPHESYAQQNYATYEGRMDDIPLDVLYENYSQGINPGHMEKFLMTKPPLATVDDRTVQRVLNYIKTQQGVRLGLAGAIAAGIISESQAREIRDQL